MSKQPILMHDLCHFSKDTVGYHWYFNYYKLYIWNTTVSEFFKATAAAMRGSEIRLDGVHKSPMCEFEVDLCCWHVSAVTAWFATSWQQRKESLFLCEINVAGLGYADCFTQTTTVWLWNSSSIHVHSTSHRSPHIEVNHYSNNNLNNAEKDCVHEQISAVSPVMLPVLWPI